MNKRLTTVIIIVLLLVFVGYFVVDVALRKNAGPVSIATSEASGPADMWIVDKVINPGKDQLNAVTVSDNGNIYLGGEPFILCYDPDFKLLWEYKTEMPVTALTASGNNIYAAVQGSVMVLDLKGQKIDEWGPFESNAMITSLTSNNLYVAFADAANKTVYVLDKKGIVVSLIGKSGDEFIIPSYYFDIALGVDNIIYIANTGNRRIERRNIEGGMLGFFGKPGIEPGDFCGCCNPSHFALIPGGFITAEKGINRIKILDNQGEFVEFVSSVNNFVPPLPLDIASPDGEIIYGANPADSKVYVFKRKKADD